MSNTEVFKKFFGHLHTINHHKFLVMKHCFKCGLYYQGIMHDLSKYSPIEFFTGVKYYQGDKSPNSAEKLEKGYSQAWLHHKGRNKHHFEYWIDYGLPPEFKLVGNPMPTRYVVEMFCDRVSACKNYMKDKYTDSSALEYFNRGKGHYHMHETTFKLLEELLIMLSEKGEKETFRYIRKEVLKNKR